MNKVCKQCGGGFEVTDEDHNFYRKISVPTPTLCPLCRQQRRAAWRNERTLYRRKCSMCQKEIVSIYHGDTEFPVFCNKCWWGDNWNPLDYGKQYDFNKNFFTQYQELQSVVPRLGLYLKKHENSDYCNHSENLKNSYLAVDTAFAENIYYSQWIIYDCKDLCDCYQMRESQLCYEGFYSDKNYKCIYIHQCDNCGDSAFLYDCKGCNHCFMCSNLRHKSYYIENKRVEKGEYEEFMKTVNIGSYVSFEKNKKKFIEMIRNRAIKKDQRLEFSINCSGNFVFKSKNVKDSYDVMDSQDCRYCYESIGLADSYDVYESGFDCELQYDTHACNRGKRLISGHVSYDVSDCCYIDSCHNSKELFGCIALRRKQNCILNKQYSKEEYEKMFSEIIKHMKKTKEWGEFFPIEISPFAYNETVCDIYYPLTESEAKNKNYKWRTIQVDSMDVEYEIPDNIRDVSNEICGRKLRCKECGKGYKILEQEFLFYKMLEVPIPRKCYFCRYKKRMKYRTGNWLITTECSKCGKEIRASLGELKKENIYCEECYLAEVY